MCVYLRSKSQVSSIILTSFRQGGNFTPDPISKQTPKKPTQSRVEKKNLPILHQRFKRTFQY